MCNKLPEYVVNCFLTSGFDIVDVIMSMDISENPGNSMESIEKFMNEHYAVHDKY